jgi:hypothetical protein
MSLKFLPVLQRLADYKSERRRLSKQMTRTLSALMVTGLIYAAAFSVPREVASMSQASAPSVPRNASIVATTVAVLKETSELRELAVLRPVRSGAQSRTEIERMIVRNLDQQTTPAEMNATEVTLKKLGLAPPEFQYRSFIVKLLTEQVAGYYDPKAQRFFLADWIDLEGQKPVMAHELTHALQDQHFNLSRFEKWPKGDSDAELAAHALIEGDATLAMTLYMAKNPMVALAFIRSLGSGNMASEQFKQAPRAIRESLVFPYEQGSEWATQLYKRGGWASVSQAYAKLPLSSEQILHPEKYFEYEVPLKIALADVRFQLGRGWKRIDHDVNGEWSFYLILDQFLNASAESRRAAAGWAGDRYAIYQGLKPTEVFILQLTAWDTANDAREFFDAYAKRTWRRYPRAEPINSDSNDRTARDSSSTQAERREWQTEEGRVLLEIQGSRVLILEGIPDNADTNALSRTAWK